jgi:hypothetical protein
MTIVKHCLEYGYGVVSHVSPEEDENILKDCSALVLAHNWNSVSRCVRVKEQAEKLGIDIIEANHWELTAYLKRKE